MLLEELGELRHLGLLAVVAKSEVQRAGNHNSGDRNQHNPLGALLTPLVALAVMIEIARHVRGASYLAG